uniref:C1q domain-containing protein n=1 Tax=Esox lucius TaxID=8010 RepID=A0A3P8ZY62_ESOLU
MIPGFSRLSSPSLSVLIVAVLLSLGRCQDVCRAQDGEKGAAGTPGRDGRPGAKGEKGEPALQLVAGLPHIQKGAKGSRGFPGDMGPKGLAGDLGPEGPPGPRGRAGPSGKGRIPSLQHRAAFSVSRNDTSYPSWNRPLTYNKAITSSSLIYLASGIFTCSTPGVYYFVFHSETKVSMCLYLRSDTLGDRKLGFCDYNIRSNIQVWLEPFKDKQQDSVRNDKKEKNIVFNGFLLFPK